MTDKKRLENVLFFLEQFANDVFELLDNFEDDQEQEQPQPDLWSEDYVDQQLHQEPLSRRIH